MCPYLVPVVADRLWMIPQSAYCRRPNSRVRVPSRTSLLERCMTSGFTACAGYRAARVIDGSRAPAGH